MSVTERVILEQFPYWEKALDISIPRPQAKMIVVVGCGTSYHLARSIAAAFNLKGRNAIAVPGGEWTRRRSAYLGDDGGVCVVALSRSGESTETVQAVEASRRKGDHTIALTCAPDTAIEHGADETVYMPTHEEEGIVMSCSASLMLLAGLRMAGFEIARQAVEEASTLLASVRNVEERLIARREHFVYLGSGALFGIAAEGALKLQEMSLSHAQPFHPLEYRHGPISLLDEATTAVMLYSEETRAEEETLVDEMRQKKAAVIGFGGSGDLALAVETAGPVRGLVVLPALQIIGERVAGTKGLDTTSPRNLTKVVRLS